jgi:hypothetical protein
LKIILCRRRKIVCGHVNQNKYKAGGLAGCNRSASLTTSWNQQRVATLILTAECTAVSSNLATIVRIDTDLCGEQQTSESVIFSGFSRTVAVQSASASLIRSTLIMSSHSPRKGKQRYGTSKHYA